MKRETAEPHVFPLFPPELSVAFYTTMTEKLLTHNIFISKKWNLRRINPFLRHKILKPKYTIKVSLMVALQPDQRRESRKTLCAGYA